MTVILAIHYLLDFVVVFKIPYDQLWCLLEITIVRIFG
jgi:hypothetical protein